MDDPVAIVVGVPIIPIIILGPTSIQTPMQFLSYMATILSCLYLWALGVEPLTLRFIDNCFINPLKDADSFMENEGADHS